MFADRETHDLGHNELLESIKLESSLKTHSCVGREGAGRERGELAGNGEGGVVGAATFTVCPLLRLTVRGPVRGGRARGGGGR